MAVWSSLALKYNQNIKATKQVVQFLTNGLNGKVTNAVPVRYCHERTLPIRTSQFHYFKLKNLLHFYLMLGIVPLALIASYVNIFIGPAELALIPEGYEPEHWEYYKHPITRFFAKYCIKSPQEVHERNLHHRFFKDEKIQISRLEKKIKNLMKERNDYQAWYFTPTMVKYHRKMAEDSERVNKEAGKYGQWIF